MRSGFFSRRKVAGIAPRAVAESGTARGACLLTLLAASKTSNWSLQSTSRAAGIIPLFLTNAPDGWLSAIPWAVFTNSLTHVRPRLRRAGVGVF